MSIEQRLENLKSEFAAGQKMLAELETKQVNLQQTMLRISGAIQVLEEMLAEEQETAVNDSAPEANGNLPLAKAD